MERGRFITLEGGEGAGKSTQTRRLADWLRARGLEAIETREPGGSPPAERIRTALLGLTAEEGAWHADAECLLHYAARRQHVADVIAPALAAGAWVISDRFADSTMAYQGYAAGVSPDRITALHGWALGDFAPDLTVVLDIDPADGLVRAASRGVAADVYERRGDEFHARVRDGFLSIARAAPDRCRVLSATASPDVVAANITAAVRDRFDLD